MLPGVVVTFVQAIFSKVLALDIFLLAAYPYTLWVSQVAAGWDSPN